MYVNSGWAQQDTAMQIAITIQTKIRRGLFIEGPFMKEAIGIGILT
jgi:hypothetical protein